MRSEGGAAIDALEHEAVGVARGELLCTFHHRLIEEGGWAIVVDADGSKRALPPGHPDNPRTPLELLAEVSEQALEARLAQMDGRTFCDTG